MFRCFPPQTLTFLRALTRNNDREWFKDRKARYEAHVRGPMLALVERLAGDFAAFAPELVASPRASLYRIYRDTRFSEDKTPLKTHVAAVFPCRGLPKHQGAGLYLEVAPGWVWVGGGMYAPDTTQLQAVREHIASNLLRLRAIVESPSFKRTVGRLDGEAAAYLRYRQFLAGAEFPPAFATSPRFYAGVLNVFRQVSPLIRFLNEPLLGQVAGSRSG
jgi:uncharacterized protein (TIGR02453 family)